MQMEYQRRSYGFAVTIKAAQANRQCTQMNDLIELELSLRFALIRVDSRFPLNSHNSRNVAPSRAMPVRMSDSVALPKLMRIS